MVPRVGVWVSRIDWEADAALRRLVVVLGLCSAVEGVIASGLCGACDWLLKRSWSKANRLPFWFALVCRTRRGHHLIISRKEGRPILEEKGGGVEGMTV
jgi:hypothetical protein